MSETRFVALPQPVHVDTVRLFMSPVRAVMVVDEAVVAKKLVVVAAVPVALRKVKFWSVDELLASNWLKVPSPVVVIFPLEVIPPPVAVVKRRLVDDAVVAKKLVVVAEVPVALTKVKF
jgi:hypothetical protein